MLTELVNENAGTARILLVDDEPDVICVIGRSLAMEGFTVITANDGHECIEKAHDEMPDLILLDNVMPKMDGITTLLKIKKSAKTRNIPVIVVTALADEQNILQALEAGARTYVLKPFDYELLLEEIHKALQTNLVAE